MESPDQQDVTQLLAHLSAGDQDALDRLLPLVYDELRRIARRQLRRERRGHTLDSVALVNEAYAKLVGQDRIASQNRAHFFAIAARAMRTILIDYARARNADKRGGGASDVPLHDVAFSLSAEQADHLTALDEALSRLEAVQAEAAQIVEYRYFGGLTLEEAAAVMGLSYATARRRWSFAKAWLQDELSADL